MRQEEQGRRARGMGKEQNPDFVENLLPAKLALKRKFRPCSKERRSNRQG